MATFTVNADDSSPLLIYSPAGAWSDSPASDTLLSSYSSGSLHTSSTQGATVTINFNGTGIEIFGGTRPNYGTFSITVDGNTIKSGSAQSQQPAFKQVLASVANLSDGPHTAVLTNTGTSPVDVDYVAIQNTLGQPGASLVTTTYDDSDQRVTYQPAGAWQTNTGAAFMGETLHYSSDPNAAASLTFTGEAYAIYGTVSPDHANIEVSVDGQVKETMVGGSGGVVSMLHSQTLLYYGNDLGPGQHTVTVKSVQGSNSGPYLDIDSFLVFSTSGGTPQPLNNNDAPLVASNTLAQPVASPTKHAHSQQAGLPLGAIIGIAVGGVVAVLIFLLIAFFLMRRRQQQQKSMTVPMEQSPASPDLPIQKPYMVEAGFSLVSPQVENVPRPLYRAPSSRAFPAHMSQRESVYSSSSSVSSHSRSGSTTSTTPMVTREVPLLKTPRPPPPARSASPLASSRPVRPLNRPPTMDFPT